MQKKKILFIADYAFDTVPGQRFRFEQYFSFLEAKGYECILSPILTPDDVRILYKPGHYFKKIIALLKGLSIRIRDVLNASDYDIIFIFREAFIAGPPLFEFLLRRSKAKIVYDFDDAIWIENVSEANKRFAFLKSASKIPKIIAHADMVFAGNPFLAEYASGYCKNVKIIPTTIDTDIYIPYISETKNDSICIGWSGSITTIQHFELATPFLKELKIKYGNRIRFKVIGDANYVNQELGIKGLAWNKDSEVNDLQEIDIGIMPLKNDMWAKGKCGLKGLQYMALGIPTVMSPVGVNTDIIHDGVNGFLAETNDEWLQKISLLIDDTSARKQMGERGRHTVAERYSRLVTREKYKQYFDEVLRIVE